MNDIDKILEKIDTSKWTLTAKWENTARLDNLEQGLCMQVTASGKIRVWNLAGHELDATQFVK